MPKQDPLYINLAETMDDKDGRGFFAYIYKQLIKAREEEKKDVDAIIIPLDGERATIYSYPIFTSTAAYNNWKKQQTTYY